MEFADVDDYRDVFTMALGDLAPVAAPASPVTIGKRRKNQAR